MEWIDIKEKQPESDEFVIINTQNSYMPEVCKCVINYNNGIVKYDKCYISLTGSIYSDSNIQYWIPLPELPKK